jgi:hypothetical protein
MAKTGAKKGESVPSGTTPGRPAAAKLLADLRELIESVRSVVAQAVNSASLLPYRQVGNRIRTDVLHSQRAVCGEPISRTGGTKPRFDRIALSAGSDS